MSSLMLRTREISKSLASGLLDPLNPVSRKLAIVGGLTASGLRFAAGMTIGQLGPRPDQALTLWDFEGCAECRLVREALTTLDLDADVRPCPPGGARFRPALGGGGVPRLEDPNVGCVLVGAHPIVAHLYQRYGVGQPPWLLNLPLVTALTGLSMRLLTAGIGARVRPSRAPDAPLELWSFEASPYCRLVRARLCELELPWRLHNLGKNSPKRPGFIARTGRMQLPWLFDPNTQTGLFESLAIEQYLTTTYGAA